MSYNSKPTVFCFALAQIVENVWMFIKKKVLLPSIITTPKKNHH